MSNTVYLTKKPIPAQELLDKFFTRIESWEKAAETLWQEFEKIPSTDNNSDLRDEVLCCITHMRHAAYQLKALYNDRDSDEFLAPVKLRIMRNASHELDSVGVFYTYEYQAQEKLLQLQKATIQLRPRFSFEPQPVVKKPDPTSPFARPAKR
jgi:hypothetical protein